MGLDKMATIDVKALYDKLNESAEQLSKSLDISYLEALAETGENILDNKTTRVLDGRPDAKIVEKLNTLYESIDYSNLSSEDIRQGFQLVLIQATKSDYVQMNHQITPDTLGLLVSYLIQITDKAPDSPLSILDLGTGSGNLLFTVYNQLVNRNNRVVRGEGVEIDDLLLSIASSSMEMQGLENVTLTMQDALTNLLIDPVDVVMSDVPIGYYPDDEHAKTFETALDEGHSYSHFLFIEQGLRYLKEDGFGFFIVPSRIFELEESKKLIQHIQSVGYFQGLIQLPKSFVSNEDLQQSILFLQKQGKSSKQANEVLISTAPEFSQTIQFQKFLDDVLLWKRNNII